MNISPQASQPLSAIRSPISAFLTFASSAPFARTSASFILHTSSFILPLLLLSACASTQPRPVADQYSREKSSRVVSRGPVPMDDAEARKLASGGQSSSTPVKKKTTSGGRTTSEETITTTTTETVVGRQAVAAPDAEVSPR
ncbi:MAG: hypothetical protein WCO94_13025 [Verrucomicrobiota bacterium]